MLNRKTHETHLRRLLSSIYLNRDLQNNLGFKGGTSLYMFYNLDRFSTDLNFNCLVEDLDIEAIKFLRTMKFKIIPTNETLGFGFYLIKKLR